MRMNRYVCMMCIIGVRQLLIYHYLFQASGRCPMNIRCIELGFPLCRTLYLENLPFRCPPCLPLCQMSCPVTCLFHLLSRVWCLAYQKSDGSFQSSKPGMASLKPVLKPIVSHFPNGKKKKNTASNLYRGLGSLIALLCLLYHLSLAEFIFQRDPTAAEGLTQRSFPQHRAASWSC